MKKITIGLLFILSIFSLLQSACLRDDFKQEITTIDSLKTHLTQLRDSVIALDMDSAQVIHDKASQILKTLHEYYDPRAEELSLEDGIKFGQFKTIKKALRNYRERHENILKELEYTSKQLQDLKESMERSEFEKKVGEQYLNDEKEAVALLEKEINSLKKGIAFAKKRYHKMENEIKALMAKVGIDKEVAW